MVRLVAMVGASPGAVYETLLNLCRGVYDCGGGSCPRVGVDRVVLVRTSAGRVVEASRVARLLVVCSGVVFPEGDGRRLPCRVSEVGVVDAGVEDIVSRGDFERFVEVVRRNLSEGDVVDVTGGRASMAVASACVAPGLARLREYMVVASVVPQEAYQQTGSAFNALLRNYDLGRVEERVFREGCEALRDYPGLLELLRQLVTGKAKTILLYP